MNHFIWPLRVYYEDTDNTGVVYYANYLKFMERARTEWLRALGFEQNALKDNERVLFVVRSIALDYHHPARFNDMLEVRSRLHQVRGASLIFEQMILRPEKPDESLCSGWIRVACVDVDSFKPRPIPKIVLMEIGGGN
jgi:acyl-CoA thioester hydrolase